MKSALTFAAVAVAVYKTLFFFLSIMDAANTCGIFEACK